MKTAFDIVFGMYNTAFKALENLSSALTAFDIVFGMYNRGPEGSTNQAYSQCL